MDDHTTLEDEPEASSREASERQLARAALEESEQRFRSLVSSLQDAVFTLAADGRITGLYGDGMPAELRQAYLGKSAVDLFDPAYASVHVKAREEALRGKRVTYECTLPSPDAPQAVEVTVSPMRDGNGHVTGLVGLAHIVTEKKQLQAQLLVADRMASVGTLAAGVAHEINNPLAAVTVGFELGLEIAQALVGRLAREQGAEALSAQVQELHGVLSEGVEAAERIRKTVADLQQFSRVAPEERPTPVDVNRVLERTLRIAANEIRHRARLTRELQPVPLVLGDEARLSQVFLSLLVNAAHAIREGHAHEHEIKVSTRLAGDGRTVIEVRDTGCGMRPEVRDRLFTPFFTTRPVGGGSGLGLSVSHRIVTRLGGEIQVETQEGRGSTFRVILPSLHERDAGKPPAAPLDLQSIVRRRGRVLVIDDDSSVCIAFARGLALEHDVEVRTNAREALELLEKGARFDVIFCDLVMPDFSGAEFIAALPEALRALVVVITGGAFTPEARAFLERTAVPTIEKPVSLRKLRKLVADRLQPEHQPRARRGVTADRREG